MPAPPHLGVDFGTSHTVAVLRRADGRVEALMFGGTALLPSGVAAGRDGALAVGSDAAHAARNDPAAFEPHPKRRIDDGTVLLGEHEFPVEDLFAAVLAEVRSRCVEVARSVPEAVTLTHPAAWGPRRRRILRSAAVKAGFATARLVPEPVAAAAYYARELGHDVPVGATVVVHDFGGGTFDASVVRRTADGFEVLAVDGLDDLGGVDIDEVLVQHLRSQYGDPGSWVRLLAPDSTADRRHARLFREDVRLAKEMLSRRSIADLHIPLPDRDVHVTREELERITAPLLSRAVEVTSAVIEESGVPPERIAGVFLVGGGSRMPLIATLLHRELGRAPVLADHIELVVAHGAILDEGPAAPQPSPATAPAPAPGPPVVPPPRAVPVHPAPRTARIPLTVWSLGFLLGLETLVSFVTIGDADILKPDGAAGPLLFAALIVLLGSQIPLWLRVPTARRLLITGQLAYVAAHAGVVLAGPPGWPEIAARLPFVAAGIVGAELAAARSSADWYRAPVGPSWRRIATARRVLTALAVVAALSSTLVVSPPWRPATEDAPKLRLLATAEAAAAYTDIAVGEAMAVGARPDGEIDVFSTATGELSGTFETGSGPITDLALSYVGGHDTAVVGEFGYARVIATDTGEELCTIEDPGSFTELATMIVDGLPLLVSGRGDEFGVWSLGDCALRERFDTGADVSGDTGVLNHDGVPVAVFADATGVTPGFDLRDGTAASPRFVLPGRPAFAGTTDGDLVTAVGSRLSAWNLTTGDEKTHVDLGAEVTDGGLAVLRDGNSLLAATVDREGTLRVCDLATGTEVGEYQLGLSERPPLLGFSRDGSQRLVVGFGGQIVILGR
ncbi:Hsp70 family protein [Phytomonospora endophytica]|uniref:Actin-like ATPase involved in cell morphogenesis n=1 Tax=Phytomonospora endophytica TaxID=714109 RepID=A0A841FGR9_9ACTN|nr:Hsp70 family protein [Phytomonospora endophytica]MBB6035064.1 actin-like ATPase involved in cell morphogenesis [Phytomonospora endophytica]GIG64189.1 hypothetical protein Pen01_04840 [Phytomonospora endophytica]